jgi:hypothetical protein
MFALVGGNSGGSECHPMHGARLAVTWLRDLGLADGNPDTLASATSRCVECLVILARVACGEG